MRRSRMLWGALSLAGQGQSCPVLYCHVLYFTSNPRVPVQSAPVTLCFSLALALLCLPSSSPLLLSLSLALSPSSLLLLPLILQCVALLGAATPFLCRPVNS